MSTHTMTDDPAEFGEIVGTLIPRIFDEMGTPALRRPILGASIVTRLADRYGIHARPVPCHAIAYTADSWQRRKAGKHPRYRERPVENPNHLVVVLGREMTLDVGLPIFSASEAKVVTAVLPPSAQYPDAFSRGQEMAWTIGANGETVVYVSTNDESFRQDPAWNRAESGKYAAYALRLLEHGAFQPA